MKRKRKNLKNGNSNRINNEGNQFGLFNKKQLIAALIAIYLAFIICSWAPILAQDSVETTMKDSYTYHLTFNKDGRQGHYYVERYNPTQNGLIDLTYTTSSNSLVVEVRNIKNLTVYCRSMYEDECKNVFGFDPWNNTNYYKWYFTERDHFNANVDADRKIHELRFVDTPMPYEVWVNGEKWEKDIDYYFEDHGIVLSNVPQGHSNVDIYFKAPHKFAPVAEITVSNMVAVLNETLSFDGSHSYDSDGEIISYIWDFGDGRYGSGETQTHSFSRVGVYGVILTVKDNDFLIDRGYVNISVVTKTHAYPEILHGIPNQERPEDSAPWSLKLTNFEYDVKDSGENLNWYITGVNTSIFTVSGGWSEDDLIIFHPVPNAYGNDEATIWLIDTDGFTDSQRFWVNITPVNDPPVFYGAPDLIVHYGESFTFDFEPYIYDIDTPSHDLELILDDTSNGEYTEIDGFKVDFNYPKALLNQIVFVTISVIDGNISVQDTITVNITSNYVPELIKKLPDITIYEGTIVTHVFDLDDYFSDADQDAIFFSFGYTHLTIKIHENNSVDIASLTDWTGIETVTFRASDPIGALSEDTIEVTVLFMNDPPTISKVPNLYVRYDYDYKFDLAPYISDPDNISSELTVWTSDPDHITISLTNNFLLLINYPEEMLGEIIKLRITIFDGIDSGFQDIFVTVTSDWPPELHKKIPDLAFAEDEAYINAFNIEDYFFDKDGDALYYTTGNMFIVVTINTDKSVDFAAPQDWYGYEEITFRATDPTGALVEDIVTVTVLPVNDRPNVAEIPTQYGEVGEMWRFDLEPYIIDMDNDISELEVMTNNENIIISGTKLVFFGSNELNGKITLTVSDGDLSATRDFEVVVNTPPEEKDKETTIDPSIFVWLMILIIILIVIAEVFISTKRTTNKETEEDDEEE